MEEIRLRTEHLAAGYDGRPVLREVAVTVRAGEVLALAGPNGAGKSTLLRTLYRQLEPLCGAVYLDGRPMASMDGVDIARRVSIVTTDRPGGEPLTVEDVVRTGRWPYTGRLGILSARDRAVMEAAMERLDVADLRTRLFRRLSDGQRQRVLLARALCQEPEVLVLDEPAAFLDLRYQLELLELLRDLSGGQGLAVVVSLHELDFIRRVADRVACIRDGTVDRTGPPDEALTPEYVERLYGLPPGAYRAFLRPMAMPPEEEPPRMRGMSEGVGEEGAENGGDGMENGGDGMEKGVVWSMQNLMSTMGWSLEQAMNALRIPKQERPRYAAKAGGNP